MQGLFGFLKQFWRLMYILCVPLLLLPVAACIGGKAGWCAYILLWMACYWSAEVVPLAVTSMMPLFLFPFFGIMPSSKVTTFYLNDIAFVLLCSLVMAGAVEVSNLHKRIALRSLLAIGTSNLRLLLGFMLVTMVLSMWIPNTASTSIMAPIAMAVVDVMHTSTKSHSKDVESSDLEFLMKQQEPIHKYKKISSRKDSSNAADSDFSEWCVMFLMSSMVLLWFTMKPQIFPGWVEMIPHQTILASPVAEALSRGKKPASVLSGGVIILVGGGMCLAEGCKQSGLSAMLVQHLKSLDCLPNVVTVFVLCFAASMFTEVMSNPTVSSILLPVVCQMALAIGVHPLYLAMPVTIGCSFSFMLPAATPPNAIVYELAKMKIADMVKPGFFMNMLCVAVEVGMIHTLGLPIFGLRTLTEWARHNVATVSPTAAPNATNVFTLPIVLTALNYTQPT
ncbi:hypothetical protein MRX96_036337 [Rhipicephalus microplus]